MMNAKLIGVATAIVGLLCGCVMNSNEAMPVDWPQTSRFTHASELSGVFIGKGSVLGAIMSNDTNYGLVAAADEFRLSTGDGTRLKMEAFAGQKLLRTVELECRLEDGAVVVDKGRGLNREGVLGRENNIWRFLPNHEGNVVVKFEGRFFGMMMIFPVIGTETKWWLLKRAAKST